MDAEPAPITIEAPAPPQPDAAPPALPAPPAPDVAPPTAAPAPEKAEPAPSKAAGVPPAAKRTTAAYFNGERSFSDAEFALASGRPPSETEVGIGTFLVSGATASGVATFDLGPTAALRSEIGRDIAVSLRSGVGVNAVRASYLDVSGNEQQAPVVSARFEVALSWLFR